MEQPTRKVQRARNDHHGPIAADGFPTTNNTRRGSAAHTTVPPRGHVVLQFFLVRQMGAMLSFKSGQ